LKRGVVSTTAIIAEVLSANSVHATPAALAKSVTAAAVVKGAAASGSILTLIKGALKLMAWAKAKTVVVGSVFVVFIVTTTTLMIHHSAQSEKKRSAAPNDWPKNALTNAGRATPEAALKSLLWAVSTANSNTIMSSLSPAFQAKAQQTWREIFQPGLVKMRKQIEEAQGFQVLSMSPPDD